MPTFHPAYVPRRCGDDLDSATRAVWKDIQIVYAEHRKAMERRG